MTSSDPFTPAALNDLMAERLTAIAAQICREQRDIAVKGWLPRIPEPWLNDFIYADLVDPVSPTKIVPLQVRPSTMREAEVQAGDTVVAYGSIVTNLSKGQPKLRLRVDRIELAEPPEEREQRRAELTALDVVRLAGGDRHRFPSKTSPRVALLCSKTSEVKEDFLSELSSLPDELSITEVPVSMSSPDHVASAIRSLQQEIMVLIRGGGPEVEFQVFDTPQVLAALREFHGFRLLGLGHKDNCTLADCVADYSAKTPTEAGRFLSEQVWKARLESQYKRSQFERERLESENKRLQSEHKRLDDENERLQGENEREAAVVADRARVLRKRGVVVALVAATILLGLLLLPLH